MTYNLNDSVESWNPFERTHRRTFAHYRSRTLGKYVRFFLPIDGQVFAIFQIERKGRKEGRRNCRESEPSTVLLDSSMQRWVNVSCNVRISRGTNPFFICFTIGGIHRFRSIHIYLFFFPTLLAIFDKLTDSRLPITDIPVLRITEGVVPNRREPLVVFIMQER